MTEVARYYIETSTKIQNEIYLNQEDFYINGDVKVFPDAVPPTRPPPVEKEENGTLTIEQLDSLRDQFLDMAPKGKKESPQMKPTQDDLNCLWWLSLGQKMSELCWIVWYCKETSLCSNLSDICSKWHSSGLNKEESCSD